MSMLLNLDSAILQATEIRTQVYSLAGFLPEDELCQMRRRMIDTVYNIEDSIANGFSYKCKIHRIRTFITVIGNLMECKDFLEYIRKTSDTDVSQIKNNIDNLSEILLKIED
jgi:four helix bundle protein